MKDILKQARTKSLCGLARVICGNIRANLVIFELEDVRPLCVAVAHLCSQHGCKKPAALCLKASRAKNDKEFLELCLKSCKACEQERKEDEIPNPLIR